MKMGLTTFVSIASLLCVFSQAVAETYVGFLGSYVIMVFYKTPPKRRMYHVYRPDLMHNGRAVGLVDHGIPVEYGPYKGRVQVLKDDDYHIKVKVMDLTRQDNGTYTLWPERYTNELIIRDVSIDIPEATWRGLDVSTINKLFKLAVEELSADDIREMNLSSEEGDRLIAWRVELNITTDMTTNIPTDVAPTETNTTVSVCSMVIVPILIICIIILVILIVKFIVMPIIRWKMHRGNRQEENVDIEDADRQEEDADEEDADRQEEDADEEDADRQGSVRRLLTDCEIRDNNPDVKETVDDETPGSDISRPNDPSDLRPEAHLVNNTQESTL